MILGISSYTFTWAIGVPGHVPGNPLSENGLLEKAAKLGTKLIQVADNLPLDSMGEERMAEFIRAASSSGIMLEVGSNRMTGEKLEKYIVIAEKAGSRLLRFVVDGEGFTPPVNDIIAIIKNAEPELKKRRIVLALENHDRLRSSEFARIIEKVGSRYLGICLDCANSFGAGEGFHEVVGTLAPYTVNFHLKEISIKRKFHKMGFDIEGKPFGQGQLPLEWMLGQLSDRCRTAILEQWTPPGANLEQTISMENDWAEQSISYLRRFIRE